MAHIASVSSRMATAGWKLANGVSRALKPRSASRAYLGSETMARPSHHSASSSARNVTPAGRLGFRLDDVAQSRPSRPLPIPSALGVSWGALGGQRAHPTRVDV